MVEPYASRLERIRRAINFEPVDRVPIVYMGTAFAPKWMGITLAEYSADPAVARDVILAAMERLGDIDGVNLVPGLAPITLAGPSMSRVAIPGREVPADSLWQILEAEVMTVEDYDRIIEQGWKAFMASYLPRVVDMAEFLPAIHWMIENIPRTVQKYREHGFVVVSAPGGNIPFELLCGGRSMARFYLDLYRRPDKVQAAMDVMMPDLIAEAVEGTRAAGTLGGWIGGFRAASGLIAPKTWNRFVFPYYLQMVNAMSDNGLVSILHWDQDWTRDLARLREFPVRKCVLNLDGMTNVRKVRELLQDHVAIMGDIPSKLLSVGQPEDVYEYVRDLVRDVGRTGLILCPGCDAPINTRPENMQAFVAAGHEFGVAAA